MPTADQWLDTAQECLDEIADTESRMKRLLAARRLVEAAAGLEVALRLGEKGDTWFKTNYG